MSVANGKKVTLATIKSFVKKNKGKLLIRYDSAFNGMHDGTDHFHDSVFQAAQPGPEDKHRLGIAGAWFIGHGSRDYFSPYSKDGLEGFGVSNACGSFVLAVKVESQ